MSASASWQMTRQFLRITPICVALVFAAMVSPSTLHAAFPANDQQPDFPRPLDATQPITYFVSDGSKQSGFRPSDKELARWALDEWQRNEK